MFSRDKIVSDRLQIINNAATTAVAFVIKFPALRENIKLSCETPIPNAPPSDFWSTGRTRSATGWPADHA